jgi:hypothetical protein
MFGDNFSRHLLIVTLQLVIIKNARQNGWTARMINDKQIEITKKYNKDDDYDKICRHLINPISMLNSS